MVLDAVLGATGRTLLVSGMATVLATAIALPLALACSGRVFRGRQALRRVITALYGLPPVAAGLAIYLLLSRSNPVMAAWYEAANSRGYLFSIEAMVLAQVVLIVPLIWGLAWTALERVDDDVRAQLLLLGGQRRHLGLAWLVEARRGVLAAVGVGLGRGLAEVGSVLMVGGNIAGRTRVLTTSIVLETSLGRFDTALALVAVLLTLSLGLAFALGWLETPRRRSSPGDDLPPPSAETGGAADGESGRFHLVADLGVTPPALSATAPVLTCEGLSWAVAGRTLLDGIDVEIHPGTITVIMGASGAGKTSLLRHLAGVIEPTAGRAVWHEASADGAVRPRHGRHGVGLVAQRRVLFAGSAERNLALGPRWNGATASEAREQAQRALRALDLPDAVLADTLSGGEAQRLALARTLLLEPAVLLLDEFTAHLDGPLVGRLEAAVRSWAQAGGAVVLATHNPLQARRLADQVLILHEGRIVARGTMSEVEASADDPIVRGLLAGEWSG